MHVQQKYVYITLHKQILVMISLSLFPGLGYIFLGWLNDIVMPALIWYSLTAILSAWGFQLYKNFDYLAMDDSDLIQWHQKLILFYFLIFSSWALIFLLYSDQVQSKMHYIAIFTELGASVVATTLLFADRRTLTPILLILMLPLSGYFFLIGELYSYVLSLFSLIFMGVLFYSANSSEKLLKRTNYQASHDQLTKLQNRHSFIDALQKKINALESKKVFSYLLLIDLDHFKTINDSLGHDIGDKVLEEVSFRLNKTSSHTNTIARLGGDEFIILGDNFQDSDSATAQAQKLANKLLKSIKDTYKINEHRLYLSASIGISLLTPNKLNANAFIKEADIAMYEAKAKGRDDVILFNDALSKRVQGHLNIEQKLHFAIKEHELYLHYQPQLDDTQKIIGCEVLTRWENHDLGFVSPGVFISIAEQTGYILELGKYVLQKSFTTFNAWDRQGIKLDQFSINISVRQLLHPEFVSDIKALLREHLDEHLHQKIIFEITETIPAEDMNKLILIMHSIKKLGIQFSLDDFGTGYSSLSYLQQMPIDELKIDQSFIHKIDNNEQDTQMVRIILAMAKTFNLKVVAEGVETQEQYQFLYDNACDIFQGFLHSSPLSKEDFEALYTSSHKVL